MKTLYLGCTLPTNHWENELNAYIRLFIDNHSTAYDESQVKKDIDSIIEIYKNKKGISRITIDCTFSNILYQVFVHVHESHTNGLNIIYCYHVMLEERGSK